jgi:L-ascorbate metabolism protein UlaG (beta-lactamase superfamily)
MTSRIVEFDWRDEHSFNKDIKFIAAPARHFSGRKFKRNQSLWASYVLQTPTEKLYLGGDSGYDFSF